MAIWRPDPRTQQPRNNFAPLVPVAGPILLEDDFNDNDRDTAKWTLGSIAFENVAVGVAEANQQVEITPLSNEASPAIYGYKSLNTYDFTAREASVRIAAAIGTGTEAWLVVALDADNYFRIWVAGDTLQTRSRAGANNSNQSHGTFSLATHTYWRIRHDDDADEIVWEYSADAATWVELRRLARPFTITAVSVYLSGGTGASVSSPALVKFDDFNLRTPTTDAAVAIDGSATILSSATFFSILSRAAIIDSVGTVTVAGVRVVSRSVAFDAAGAISSVGVASSPASTFERSAALDAAAGIESSATFLSVFERVVDLDAATIIASSAIFFSVFSRPSLIDAIGALASVGQRELLRSALIDGAGGATVAGTSFTVFARVATIDAAGSIQSSVTFFSVFSANATIDAGGDIGSSGAFFSTLERALALNVVGVVESSAIFFSISSGTVLVDSIGAIQTSGEIQGGAVLVERSASFEATGTVEGDGFAIIERPCSISATSDITTAAVFFSIVTGAVSVSLSSNVESAGKRDIFRSASVSAVASINLSATFFSTVNASAEISAVAGISTSGSAGGQAVERTVIVTANGNIVASGIQITNFRPRGTITVGLDSRSVVIPGQLRTSRIEDRFQTGTI